MKRKKVIMERVIKLSQSNDDWDIKFWQKCGVQARFSAAWEMISEFYKIRRKNDFKPRLQRTVEHIKQINA